MENASRDGPLDRYTSEEKVRFSRALSPLDQCEYRSALQHREFGGSIGDSAATLREFEIKATELLEQGRSVLERQTGALPQQYQGGQSSRGGGRETGEILTPTAMRPSNTAATRTQPNTSVRRLPLNPSGGR